MLTEINISPSPHGGLQGACGLASFGASSQIWSVFSFLLCVQAAPRLSLLFLLHSLLPAPAAVACCLAILMSLGSLWLLGVYFSCSS